MRKFLKMSILMGCAIALVFSCMCVVYKSNTESEGLTPLERSCVVTSIYKEDGTIIMGCGSGSLFSDGWVLTAKHVVEDANSVSIEWSDGTQEISTEIMKSKNTDVAFVKVKKHGNLVNICDDLKENDNIYCISSPFCRIEHAKIYGNVVRCEENYIYLDMTVIGGMSGGSCYKGNSLIGIVYGYQPDRINCLTIITPASVIWDEYMKLCFVRNYCEMEDY